MKKNELQVALEDAGLDVRSYSGRSMFGRTCLAVEASFPEFLISMMTLAQEGALEEKYDEILAALNRTETDQMGRGEVIYWPDVPFVEEEDAH